MLHEATVKHIRNLSNEELDKYSADTTGAYTLEAIEFARNEFARRKKDAQAFHTIDGDVHIAKEAARYADDEPAKKVNVSWTTIVVFLVVGLLLTLAGMAMVTSVIVHFNSNATTAIISAVLLAFIGYAMLYRANELQSLIISFVLLGIILGVGLMSIREGVKRYRLKSESHEH